MLERSVTDSKIVCSVLRILLTYERVISLNDGWAGVNDAEGEGEGTKVRLKKEINKKKK